jgi:hypothetical protein
MNMPLIKPMQPWNSMVMPNLIHSYILGHLISSPIASLM